MVAPDKHTQAAESPMEAIVLAAGFSVRMGKSKALLKIANSETFVERCVRVFLQAGCRQVIVVANPRDKELMQQFCFGNRVTVLVNQHPERGRFSSVICGMTHVSETSPVFIHNVDNPLINLEIVRHISENFKSDYTVPVFQTKGGHPVLLGMEVVRAIQQEKNDQQSLKTYLSSWKKHTLVVPFPEVLCNLNSVEDVIGYFGKV
jgi:CTP:molybdopterin cytidylyltransferase MocA